MGTRRSAWHDEQVVILDGRIRLNGRHNHIERPHPGLDNELSERRPTPPTIAVQCEERLGGLLEHDRAAA